MSAETFSVEYDGLALESGQMDVRELAPALLAIGELCREANVLLNGSTTKVSLDVKADFKRGSFDVHLHLALTWFEHARAILLGGPQEAKEILELLGFYGTLTAGAIKGVIKLAKAIGPNKIQETESLGDGTSRITLVNKVKLIADDRTLALYKKRKVSAALDDVIAPLKVPDIDTFRVLRGDTVEETVGKADLPAFDAMSENLEDPNLVSDSTVERTFEVTTGSKSPEHLWRLSDGSTVITVHIDDGEFFQDLESARIVVSLGDLLTVRLRTITVRDGGKLRTTNTVEKVIGHKPIVNLNNPPPALDFG